MIARKTKTAIPKKKRSKLAIIVTTLSLIGAGLGQLDNITKLGKSFWLGLPFNQVDSGEKQNALYRRNFKCPTQVQPIPLKYKGNIKVLFYFCPSGDILLDIDAPETSTVQPGLHWIDGERFKKQQKSTGILNSMAAYAAITMPRSPKPKPLSFLIRKRHKLKVLCQGWINQVLMWRLVQYTRKVCEYQVVHSYTGHIMQRKISECRCGK